jgi:RNA polymerase sigma factor (sigma-70 family)
MPPLPATLEAGSASAFAESLFAQNVMSDAQTSRMTAGKSGERFPETRWTLISQVRGVDDALRASALEALCGAYWYPIYAVVRDRGYPPHDAEDFTQNLFERFLSRDSFAAADRKRGRLRTYLLTSLQHLLTEDWRKRKTARRGGSAEIVSLDVEWAENRFRSEPAAKDALSPEKQFDRRWLLLLMARVEKTLTEEYCRRDKRIVFETLSPYLLGEPSQGSYAKAAEQLGLEASNVKVLVHRLRDRFRSLLREEVAKTVRTPEEVETELRHLREVFR